MIRASALALPLGLLAVAIAVAQPAGLPDSIRDYWSWTRMNLQVITANETGAHPQPKDVYINLMTSDFVGASGMTITPFPNGTIVIKERTDPDTLMVDRLYMMEKIDGAWTYSFFDRQVDGTFAGQHLGTDNFCRACHQNAATDNVFVEYQRR